VQAVDPKVQALAKDWLIRTQQANPDRSQLEKRINAVLTPALISGAAKSLAPLGPLTGFTFVRSSTIVGPMTHKRFQQYTFLATFRHAKLNWFIVLDDAGKIAGIEFAPYSPKMHLSESQLVNALQKEAKREATAGRFSGAVLVAHDGKAILAQAYGLADRERKIPNTLATRFRIGSMNKMFTAVAIMQLVEGGKIALDAPLGRYVTDYPNKDVATKVTIHDLLTHTGGTGDIFGPEFDSHRLQLRTLDDYVSLYGKRGLKFTPGSRFDYSNYGFILLGVVIERVSGENYYDYVRERVYEPAGMTSTGSDAESQVVPDRSVGYTSVNGKLQSNTETLPYRGTSAGGGYSTVEDLLRFAIALQNNALLDAAHMQVLTTGKVDMPSMPDNPRRYAYGFGDEQINGVRCFGHNGGAPGMNGDLTICPVPGYIVAVLANMDPPAAEDISAFTTARLPAR